MNTKTDVLTETIKINPILVISFLEYLGYLSPMIDWVDMACKDKESEPFQRMFLYREAKVLYKKALEEYTHEELKSWFNEFYPVILKKYEKSLTQKWDLDMLPF